MSKCRKHARPSIGIFLPNWLGDCVMATPALRAIRGHFSDSARVIGIMRPYLKELLAGTGWLDDQWYFDAHHATAQTGHAAILRRIRAARFDMMVFMTNSPRPAVLAWLGGAKERIGYARNFRSLLLTGKVYRPRAGRRWVDLPMVDYYLRLAESIGCPPESRRLELATTAADEQSADEVFRNLGVRQDGRLVTLNCSGAYGGSKLWPVEHFAEIGRRIAGHLDHDVLVMCGPDERRTAEEIVKLAASPRVFSMAGQPLGIGTAKACIRRSRLMVSTDSGPRHIAAALGCAVITVYGPMSPVWGRNPTVDAVDLYLSELDCIGCGRRTCPRGHHLCMRGLSPERVYGEVAAWMTRHQGADRPAAFPKPENLPVPAPPPSCGPVGGWPSAESQQLV